LIFLAENHTVNESAQGFSDFILPRVDEAVLTH